MIPTDYYDAADALIAAGFIRETDNTRDDEVHLCAICNCSISKHGRYTDEWWAHDAGTTDHLAVARSSGVADTTAETKALQEAVAAVLALHQPFEWSFGYGPVKSCKHCVELARYRENSEDATLWPCPTVQALGVADTTERNAKR